MFEVHVAPRGIDAFAELVSGERLAALERAVAELRALLGGRTVWTINSTAAGGGVAELLRSIVRYARGLGVPARWLVVEGPAPFFRITKRLHNALHDLPGDGSALGPDQALLYERVLHDNAIALDGFVRAGDVVICHDPQTAGLIPHLMARGIHVLWRCHIGHESRGPELERGWEFLRSYIHAVPLAVFSRGAYAPAWLPETRAVVVAPTIDPFSPKNQTMDEAAIPAILSAAGLVAENGASAPLFRREDGSFGRVNRRAATTRLGPAPAWGKPLVVQVSRWDRMKDPRGVLDGFARHVASGGRDVELVLAGPQMRSVADDPEAPQVFREVETAWRQLPEAVRRTIQLAQLPMEDEEENAAIVNALQRHAVVIVQKSLREGFGLTVTEAMWKGRPVVASAVGGIVDQIHDELDGLLVPDPADLRAFAERISRVLDDEAFAARLGAAAHQRVLERSLSIASLEQWAALLRTLLRAAAESRSDPSANVDNWH